MNVKFVAKTQPAIQDEQGRTLSAEELIVYCARVSNPANQLNTSTAPKLLAYCIRNKHWSVFEQADMTVEITTSRGVSPQILRHNSFRFQEFSQRYSKAVGSQHVELRMQGTKNRQGGEELLNNQSVDDRVLRHIEQGFVLYDDLIQRGVAFESARFILPLSTTTTLYMKGSVRSWIHYTMVRLEKHAQKEHRLIAQQIRALLREHFPNVIAAVEEIETAKAFADDLERAVREHGEGKLPADHLLQLLVQNIDTITLAMRS